MDERTLRKALSDIPLGGLRYFEKIGSTNDTALAWATDGAPNMALVYAEEQTAGRGRGCRSWYTPPGAALAFSLVLKPLHENTQSTSLFSGLVALAVCDALTAIGLQPEIKWPNDVLLNRRKVCGILTESVWMGEQLESLVLGVGVNVKPEAIPPPDQLNFPATCIESELTHRQPLTQPIDRASLLQQILQAALHWRDLVATDIFLEAWESHLAFCGENVEVWVDGQLLKTGQVDGLKQDGSLCLSSPEGKAFTIQFGEVHLRPVE